MSVAIRCFMIIIFSLLAGCGFHLRGTVALAPPLQSLYVQSQEAYSPLTRNLKLSLALSGVTLAATAKDATTILTILRETTSEQLLSVGGTQQTRQYNLNLTTYVEIKDASGKMIVPEESITETRAITIQANTMLGGSNEENNLYQQMRISIVSRIMNWLASQHVTRAVMNTPR